MSQNHGQLRVADGQLPPSTFSTRSDYGSGFEVITNPDQPQMAGYGSNGGFAAPLSAHGGDLSMGGQRVALPSGVKYPPSYQQRQPQQIHGHTHLNAYPSPQPRPLPATSVGTAVPPGMPTPPMSNEYGPGVVSDVIRQLDLAAEENDRLRHTLQENNRILEAKVQEIQNCLESRDRDKQELQDRILHLERELQEAQKREREMAQKREREMAQREESQRKSMPARVENTVDETTNKLFEAQVAVMGFKCRVMQLKGELDDLRKEGGPDAGAQIEIERLMAENSTLREDLSRAKRERDAAVTQPTGPPASASREKDTLMKKIRDLSELSASQDLIIRDVNQQLNDKQALLASETDRMHQQNQRLQGTIQSLQGELQRVQNQLASHQHNSEQQLSSLTAQLNISRQEQSRTQELAKQLSIAHAEISTLRSNLTRSEKEVEKFKKKSEVYETRVKDSTSKMMSMQDQMKGHQKTGPVPKPRGDLAQLKTEKEQLETQLATTQSLLDRERRARDGAERELQEERIKNQEIMMKQTQLMKQPGVEGEAVKGSFEEAKQHLERSVGESEARVREKEADLRRVQLEVQQMKREKTQDEATIAELQKERKQAVDAKIETESKLASANEELTTLKNTTGKSEPGKAKVKPTETRLNEYAGKLATLEGLFEEEKAAKTKLQTRLDEEKKRVEELERNHLELERKKDELEGETIRNLQQQKSETDQHVDQLRAEMSMQKQNYERKIQDKETALHSREKELEDAQQNLRELQAEKAGEVQELRQNLQRWHSESQQKEEEITRMQQEQQNYTAQLHALTTEKETLRANENQISIHLRDALRENDRFKQELANAQKVAGEFRKECESLVADLQGAAKKIEALEEERDRYRNQANMGVRELAQRAERVKALEGERKTLQEQLQHMDLQLKQYMADFRKEREMRESAFQVKEMAERKQHELSSEVSQLQRQLTEMQTVKHMDSDVGNSEEPPSVAGVGAMGGREGGHKEKWSGSSGGQRSSEKYNPAAPSLAASRPPNEQSRPMFPNSVDTGINAPPLPPKPVPDPRASVPQQFVGPGHAVGGQGFVPHPRQELVTPHPMPFAQAPVVSQPLAGMATGGHMPMAPHPRAVGPPQVTPHPRAVGPPHIAPHGGPPQMPPHPRPGGPPQMSSHPRASGPPHNIPMTPYSRAEGMPMDPHSGGVMAPHSGGVMAPDSQMRPGGMVTGAQLGGIRQVPVSRPVVSEPLQPPRPARAPEGSNWVAPGDIVNTSRPEVACPLCGRNDFATQTDLEIHCAQCTM